MPIGHRGDWIQPSRDAARRVWRGAAYRYATRLAGFAATSSIVGAAASTAVNIVKGTKRALGMGRSTRPFKRARVVKDPNTDYKQRKVVKEAKGRSLPLTVKKLRLLNSHVRPVYERFGSMDADGLDRGNYSLHYQANTTDSVGNSIFPVYTMELTSTTNYQNSDNSYRYPVIFRRLCKYNDVTPSNSFSGNFNTQPVYGRSLEDDGDAGTWLIDRGVGPTAAGRKQMIEHVDFRFMFYGAKKVPSTIELFIIQFHDVSCVPSNTLSTDPGGMNPGGTAYTEVLREPYQTVNSSNDTDRDKTTRWNNFWGSFTDGLIGNPIGIRPWDRHKVLNVLNYKKFEFQPWQGSEYDGTGHQIQYHLRYNMDKLVDYTNSEGHLLLTTNATKDEFADPDETFANYGGTQVTVFPDPRGQVYMLIRGSCPKSVSTLAEIDDFAPSFDMVVRRKRSRLHIG